jgi:NAD(P)-dependent dehydrogenase (short-subunit alcohol dehydrogenase family)
MTVNDEGFEGLRVLVTGGTRGMGEATAPSTRHRGGSPRCARCLRPARLHRNTGAAEFLQKTADSQGIDVDNCRQAWPTNSAR